MTASKKAKKKSVVKVFFDVFLYGVMFILLGGLALSFLTGSLKQFNYQTYLIQSGSMEPTIRVGDVVIIKKTTYKDFQKKI